MRRAALTARAIRRLRAACWLAAALAATATAALPADAQAGVVRVDGTKVVFEDTAAAPNELEIWREGTAYKVVDVQTPVTAGAGCSEAGGVATCPGSSVTALEVSTGPADDAVTLDTTAAGGITVPATLRGGAGADDLNGGGGDDLLDGQDNADDLYGHGGDDRLLGGPGASSFEYCVWDSCSTACELDSDTLDGGAGTDVADYSARTHNASINLAGWAWSGGSGCFDGWTTNYEQDEIADVENALGGAGNDTITGNASANVLEGGAGDDVLGGLGEDPPFGCLGTLPLDDTLAGGPGSDTASYANRQGRVEVDLPADRATTACSYDVLGGIENARGGQTGDTLIGDGGANALHGEAGADVLQDGGGAGDVLDGAAGNDRLESLDAEPDTVWCGADDDAALRDDADTIRDACEQRSLVNTAPPVILGTPREDAVAQAEPGEWDGAPAGDRAYRWQLCAADGSACEDIAGATAPTYTPADGQAGRTLRVVVSASNSVGGGEASSSDAVPVEIGRPVSVSPPSVVGEPVDGTTLTCAPGTWRRGPVELSYRWLSDGAEMSGAVTARLPLTGEDVGRRISCRVTATGPGGVTSAQSAAVGPVGDRPTASGGGDQGANGGGDLGANGGGGGGTGAGDGSPSGSGSGTEGAPADQAGSAAPAITVRRSRLRSALRKGVVVKVAPRSAGRVTATLALKRRAARRLGLRARGRKVVVARAAKVYASPRRATLRLRFRRAARRRLAAARSLKLTLRVRHRTEAGTVRAVRTIRLRR